MNTKYSKKLINFPITIVERIEKYMKENSIIYFSTAVMEILRIGLDNVENR